MRRLLALGMLATIAFAGDGVRGDVEALLESMKGDLPPFRAKASDLLSANSPDWRWLFCAAEGDEQKAKAAPQGNPPAPPPAKRAAAGEKTPVESGTLPETTVEAATLTERPLSETVPSVNVVTKKEIQEKTPLGVTEATNWQPGMWSTQGSSGQVGTPVIRGWQGNQVLLLLDGLRLTNERTPTGPGPDWESLDVDMIDRIEVLRNPDSVLYGTGAIGGVTALYTRFPTDYTDGGVRYGGDTRLTVATGGNNFWRWRIQGDVATPTFRGAVGATFLRANDMEAANNIVLAPTAFTTDACDVELEGRLDEHNTLGGSLFIFRKNWNGNFLHPDRMYDNWLDRDGAAVRWTNTAETAAWDDFQVQIGAVRNAQTNDRTDIQDRNEYEIWTPQGTVYFHKGIADHAVTYGLSTYTDIDDTKRTKSTGTVRGVPKGYIFDIGPFAQDEWQATKKIRVVYGIRFDWVYAKTDPNASTTDPLITPDDQRISQGDFAWTGKVGARYEATDKVAFTGNFSRGYRFPSLVDLVGFDQRPDEIVVGDPTTQPEYSNTLEGGVHYTSSRWRGSLVSYVSWYQNAIIREYGTFNGMSWIDRNGNGVQDSDEDIYKTTNAGHATFWGIEAAAAVDVNPQWTVFGNLTWWDGHISPDPTEPTGIPFNGTLGVNFHPIEKFYVQLSSHMVASFNKIPQDLYNNEAFFWRDPQDETSGTLRSDHSVPGYTLFDLRFGIQLTEKALINVGVENLLDRQYRAFGSRHDGPGLTVTCGLSFDF
jgi:hemoglobin/transferrin/lactoferrin receptor protein